MAWEIAVNDDAVEEGGSEESISGRAAALYFSSDPSLAQLLTSHGIKVRDFILLSFLSDQGPLALAQLARLLSIDPSSVLKSVKRLAAAGLVIRDPISPYAEPESLVKLTGRGQDTANRIDGQL